MESRDFPLQTTNQNPLRQTHISSISFHWESPWVKFVILLLFYSANILSDQNINDLLFCHNRHLDNLAGKCNDICLFSQSLSTRILDIPSQQSYIPATMYCCSRRNIDHYLGKIPNICFCSPTYRLEISLIRVNEIAFVLQILNLLPLHPLSHITLRKFVIDIQESRRLQ